ncbi:sigma factor [Bradyrhizobium sp. 48]|uniref:sigma factor n=1 Tax=Bradyrhizobium sp. 48 TaxID=2782676 RepID=UPI003211C7D0
MARAWRSQSSRRPRHLRLAAKVAKGYQGYGLPLADIISEASLGLVIAATRFEPGRDSRFSRYAL